MTHAALKGVAGRHACSCRRGGLACMQPKGSWPGKGAAAALACVHATADFEDPHTCSCRTSRHGGKGALCVRGLATKGCDGEPAEGIPLRCTVRATLPHDACSRIPVILLALVLCSTCSDSPGPVHDSLSLCSHVPRAGTCSAGRRMPTQSTRRLSSCARSPSLHERWSQSSAPCRDAFLANGP
eukprot:364852-Chlamydomonas_euryale.AAC.13